MRARIGMGSNPRGMAFVLIFLVLTLPACSGPSFKFPKPELSGIENSSHAGDTPSSRAAISAMQVVAKISDTEFVPPLMRLIEASSSCNGCDKLREPIKDSLRGSHRLYVELLRAENAIRLSAPDTEKDKQIVATSKELIRALKIIVALTLESLADADAYVRSSEEWNLSQLSKENETSLQKTSHQLGAAKKQVLQAKGKFLAALN
ncbi:MAG: hypothetical protein Q7T37_00630 [bacterium]|nr:hypothetical protein [bacterium]MDO8741921.1 hypothetical protein [bacterium]